MTPHSVLDAREVTGNKKKHLSSNWSTAKKIERGGERRWNVQEIVKWMTGGENGRKRSRL